MLIDWLAASAEHPDLQIQIASLLQLTAAYSIIGCPEPNYLLLVTQFKFKASNTSSLYLA
jgi:hypothetical protein